MLVAVGFPDASAALLKAALFHDLPEITTGDVPAVAKWINPELKDILQQIEDRFIEAYELEQPLTAFELRVLEWCDMMELIMYCMEEVKMGNEYATTPLMNGLGWFHMREAPNDAYELILLDFTREWESMQ